MAFTRWKNYGHRHLGRMAITSVLLLLLPCLLALWLMMQQTYDKLMTNTRANYSDTLHGFSGDFVRQLDSLRDIATRIAVESRDRTKQGYKFQLEDGLRSSYFYLGMRDAVTAYHLQTDRTLAIYFNQLDAVVDSAAKYTAQTYNDYLTLTYAPQESEAFRTFLQAAQSDGELSFFSSCAQPGGILIAAGGVRLGTSRAPAKVLFLIRPGELNTVALTSQLGTAAQLGIYNDAGTLLYASGTVQPQWAAVPEARNAGRQTVEFEQVSYDLFEQTDELALHYVLLVPYQQLAYSLNQFYHVMQLMIVLTGIILLAAVGAILFIGYAPIFRIVRKYGVEHERDEFSSLQKSFEQMSSENSTKEGEIIDLLYRNMLYGVPISSEQSIRLRNTGVRAFCVLILSPLRLTSEESGRLTHALFEQLQIRTYITDLLPEPRTAVICFLNATTPQQAADVAMQVLTEMGSDAAVYAGETVESINEIHRSFLSCGEQEKARAEASPAAPQQTLDNLTQDIVNYIQENYADLNLSRTTVADHFRISVYSLSRVFKNQLDTGFAEYLIHCRLTHVIDLLEHSEQSVAEISDACGFASASYLSKPFKSVYGMTPGQYRQQRNR